MYGSAVGVSRFRVDARARERTNGMNEFRFVRFPRRWRRDAFGVVRRSSVGVAGVEPREPRDRRARPTPNAARAFSSFFFDGS